MAGKAALGGNRGQRPQPGPDPHKLGVEPNRLVTVEDEATVQEERPCTERAKTRIRVVRGICPPRPRNA